MITVRTLTESELAWANERYAEIHFLPSQPTDRVAVADVDEQKAGLGRLVPIAPDAAELGGIYVLPDFRGRQVAGAIVSFLLDHSPYRQLYCVPFRHRGGFYKGFGFEEIPCGSPVPSAIAEKANWCAREHADPVSVLVCAWPHRFAK